MAYQVKCVSTDNSSPHDDCRSITTIGIPVKGGGTNRYTPEQIHGRINNGDEFYVKHNGSRTDLIAAKRGSTKYVRTEPNDTPDDNLLKQPSC